MDSTHFDAVGARRVVAYLRSHKGGALPRPQCSLTEVRFADLVKCIGFEAAAGFARYTASWNENAPVVSTYKLFLEYETQSKKYR